MEIDHINLPLALTYQVGINHVDQILGEYFKDFLNKEST